MGRLTIDDPTLALIARFAGCCTDLEVSDEYFMREQLLQVRSYVDGFPSEERHERTLEWIARNAEEYRRKWDQQQVAGKATVNRCSDCPLERRDGVAVCEIHARWLDLLNGYVAGEASSREYVEDTLSLLTTHKQRLRETIRQVAHA